LVASEVFQNRHLRVAAKRYGANLLSALLPVMIELMMVKGLVNSYLNNK